MTTGNTVACATDFCRRFGDRENAFTQRAVVIGKVQLVPENQSFAFDHGLLTIAPR